jgi:hypothetical protein
MRITIMRKYIVRFFVLVISLFFSVLSYAQEETYDVLEAIFYSSGKRRLGVGLTFRQDQYVYSNYFWKANRMVATYRRKDQWSLSAQWQLLAKSELLWLTLEGSYQRDQVTFDENDMKILLWNYAGPDFEEKISYSRYAITPGIQIEPLANFGLSPYFNVKAFFVFPTHLRYDYDVTSTNIPSNVIKQTVENGALISLGWEYEAGLRAQVHPKVVLYTGFYYQQFEQKIDWPQLESREIKDIILGFYQRGFIVRLHYIW